MVIAYLSYLNFRTIVAKSRPDATDPKLAPDRPPRGVCWPVWTTNCVTCFAPVQVDAGSSMKSTRTTCTRIDKAQAYSSMAVNDLSFTLFNMPRVEGAWTAT